MQQDPTRLALEHRKEELKLQTQLLKIQVWEDGIISHASLNRDNNHDENCKILQVSISPQQPAPECLTQNIPRQMEFEDSAKASDMRLRHSTPKEKEISVKGIASPSLKETFDHQKTGINSENTEGKILQGSPECVETSSAGQTTIKYTNPGKGTSPPFADDRSGSSFHELMLDLQQEQASALTLPPNEEPCFSGDPIEYCTFIRAFESLIETKTKSPSARLYYLIQFTSGDAQELMRSCLPMGTTESYDRAKGLLKSKFGQNYQISTAYAERIMKAPQIKAEDGQALQRYLVLLTSCKNPLKEIGFLNKLHNPDTLRRIVEKLPFALRRRWRDVADSITEEQKRDKTTEDITEFVDKRARVTNHPQFGHLKESISETRNRSMSSATERKRKPTFTTCKLSYAFHHETVHGNASKDSKIPKCILCTQQHWLSCCKAFRQKSKQERLKFVREKGLCDNCLQVGHMAKSCPKESFCKVENCKVGRKHSTFLHVKDDGEKLQGNIESTSMQVTTNNGCINRVSLCSSTGAGTTQATGMPIVPVQVKAKNSSSFVEVYAFLDPGSNTTFCTKRLINRL